MEPNPNTTLWVDAQAKAARDFGIGGTGRNGRQIRPRKMRLGCPEKCRYGCSKKISLDERKIAFTNFWLLGDHTKQWECVRNWINTVAYKQNDSISEDTDGGGEIVKKRKNFYHAFSLPGQNGPVKVCQQMFLRTLDISYSWVRTADMKINLLEGTSGLDIDGRGKHRNRPSRVAEELKKSVREHIATFPVVEMQEDQEDATLTKKYLAEKLSVHKMFSLYKVERKRDKLACVSYKIYKQILENEFNYEFVKPRKSRTSQNFDEMDGTHKNKKVKIHKDSWTHKIFDNKTGCVVGTPEKVFVKSEDSLSVFEDAENSVSSRPDETLDECWTASPTHFLHNSDDEEDQTESSNPAATETDQVITSCPNKIMKPATSPPAYSKNEATPRQYIECAKTQLLKFDFEKEKFRKEVEIQDRQLKLEEEKFSFEKEFRSRELELKKLEMEKDERIKKLEMEKNERIAMYEIEMKYRMERLN